MNGRLGLATGQPEGISTLWTALLGACRVVRISCYRQGIAHLLMTDGWIQDYEELDESALTAQLDQFGEMIAGEKARVS